MIKCDSEESFPDVKMVSRRIEQEDHFPDKNTVGFVLK